jgi:predicted nucleic acid-binding Zn ribbon protein
MENQKKCIQCNELIPEDSQFCWSCGAVQQATPKPASPLPDPGVSTTAQRKSSFKPVLIGILVIVVCLLTACCAFFGYDILLQYG